MQTALRSVQDDAGKEHDPHPLKCRHGAAEAHGHGGGVRALLWPAHACALSDRRGGPGQPAPQPEPHPLAAPRGRPLPGTGRSRSVRTTGVGSAARSTAPACPPERPSLSRCPFPAPCDGPGLSGPCRQPQCAPAHMHAGTHAHRRPHGCHTATRVDGGGTGAAQPGARVCPLQTPGRHEDLRQRSLREGTHLGLKRLLRWQTSSFPGELEQFKSISCCADLCANL